MNDPANNSSDRVPLTRFLSPRYWPVWLGVAAMRVGAMLPFAWQMRIGRLIGDLARRFAGSRRRIAEKNLAACFPDLDEAARAKLLREHFHSVGIGLVEISLGWWGDGDKLRKLATIHGLEHLQDALRTGRGVLLLAGHFTTIEIGGTILSLSVPFHAMYRKFENPLFEEIIRRGRLSRVSTVIRRGDFRAMMRSLKGGNAVLYMPDQAYVRSNSVQVPFFGVPAPTSTGTARLARSSGALVVPFLPLRRADASGYELHLYPALDTFPSDDPVADTARLNAVFESHVNKAPAQYLWIHRRFKGVAGIY